MPKLTRAQKEHAATTVAVSLQEASTWLHQAELALNELPQARDQEIRWLQTAQHNIARLHNRYSHIKMSG